MNRSNRDPATLVWSLGLTLPTTATEAGARFFDAWARTNSLVPLIFGNAGQLGSLPQQIIEILVALPLPVDKLRSLVDETFQKLSPQEQERNRQLVHPLTRLAANEQLLWELVFCRQVDNFLSYLSAVLYEAFVARPEILKEKEKTIDWATVISQATIQDVVRVLAERKVEELAYKSFADLRAYFESKRGLPIGNDDDCRVVNDAIAVRNIFVHNGCVINKQYVKLVPSVGASSVGCFKWIGLDDFERLARVVGKLVIDLDGRAAEHFKLAAWPLEVDPEKHPLADEPPPISDDPD